MNTLADNPYSDSIDPVVSQIVNDFGSIHGEELVRDYAERLLWINTCGQGLHPDDVNDLLEQVRFSAEAVTQSVVRQNLEDPLSFIDMVDVEAREKLLADETLTHRLMSDFTALWPNGRDTILPG